MKIICAPDSYKETLPASQVAQAMARGIHRANPAIEVDLCPIGDGGEGTMEALINALKGTVHHAEITGPLGDPVHARYGVTIDGSIAVVELAEASGLALVPHDRRDPTETTTFGTGELIRLAAKSGCKRIIVCMGGSATIDGGTGIIQALGGTFWDHEGKVIKQPMTGGMLMNIARCRRPNAKSLPMITVACDVTNPLVGVNGAAGVYGPQKGATRLQIQQLNNGLMHFAQLVGGDPNLPGTGAAGGAAFGLMAMCDAQLERGIDLVLNLVNFNARCATASLVLTGEGRLDRQSLHGKACSGVARAAAAFGVPTIAIVGAASHGSLDCLITKPGGYLQDFVSLVQQYDMPRSMHEPASLIEEVAAEIARNFSATDHK